MAVPRHGRVLARRSAPARGCARSTRAGPFLAFLYAPPWAILWAPISLLPIDVVVAGLLVLQVLALRYIVGSWLAVGLVAWIPFVPRELATGNVDFLMAAAILAGIRGSGWPISLFAFAKFSPALVMLGAGRRQWGAAVVAGLALVAITLPWWHLWIEWVAMLLANPEGGSSVVPLIVRLPIVVALRRGSATVGARGGSGAAHAGVPLPQLCPADARGRVVHRVIAGAGRHGG